MSVDALLGHVAFDDVGGNELSEPIPDQPARGRRGGGGAGRRASTRTRKPAGVPARRDASGTPTLRAVTAELTAYAELGALVAVTRCAECAEVIHAQAEPIAAALARLVMRYPPLLKLLRTGTALADVAQITQALKPVYLQVHGHHFSHDHDTSGGGDDGTPYGPNIPGRYAPYPGPRAVV